MIIVFSFLVELDQYLILMMIVLCFSSDEFSEKEEEVASANVKSPDKSLKKSKKKKNKKEKKKKHKKEKKKKSKKKRKKKDSSSSDSDSSDESEDETTWIERKSKPCDFM